MLGFGEYFGDYMCRGEVFWKCALESVTVPSTLIIAEPKTFGVCTNLKRVEFSDGITALGGSSSSDEHWKALFKESGVEEVVLPSTLREMTPNIFDGCDSLKTVWVAKGCRVKVRKLVGKDVEVRRM